MYHNFCHTTSASMPRTSTAITLIPQSPFNTSCWQRWCFPTSHLIPAVLSAICPFSFLGCGEVVSFFIQQLLSISTDINSCQAESFLTCSHSAKHLQSLLKSLLSLEMRQVAWPLSSSHTDMCDTWKPLTWGKMPYFSIPSTAPIIFFFL